MAVFMRRRRRADVVFLIRHLFHPHHGYAIQRFLNSDVSHRGGGRCAVPVLMPWRAPNDVTCADLHNRFAFTLGPTTTSGDNEGLAQGMGVPCGAGTWLKRDTGYRNPCRFWREIQRINSHSAREVSFWAFCRSLRANTFQFHICFSSISKVIGRWAGSQLRVIQQTTQLWTYFKSIRYL